MIKPYVITINAVSGGGKTTLARLIQESLPASALFCFDDFSNTNIIPEDFYEWSRRGADPLEIDCPVMGEAVEQAIHLGSLNYIVLDCPLGREHPRFSNPVVALALEGHEAIGAVRAMVGATRPWEAAAGTIRGDYAMMGLPNLIHASDAEEKAKNEIALWFKPDELATYSRDLDKWVNE